jgi:hypothetical protein
MIVFIPSAVIICLGLTSILDITSKIDFEKNPKLTTDQIIYVSGCSLGVLGSLFGFFSTITYAWLVPKSAAQYGSQKKWVSLIIIAIITIILTN